MTALIYMGLMACAGLLVFGVHLLTKDKTGWRRWLPMTGAALGAVALAVGAVLVVIVMAFFNGGSHKQRGHRR